MCSIISIPQENNIRCMICKTRVQPEDYSMIEDAYRRNKLNCRLFLQDAPEAMAAPISDQELCKNGGSIYVIFTKDFFEDPTFQDQCVALNIEVVKQLDPIPPSVFKDCLQFTIEYKLAPQWIKIVSRTFGPYLVEGQDFLSNKTEYANAIQLIVEEIRDNIALVQLRALKLKIPSLKRVTADSNEVYVLPSWLKPNFKQKYNEIQEMHSFENYKDLCAHWKNLHGFTLPDYEKRFSFYDVEFSHHGNIYIYPETCLTIGLLEEVPLDDLTSSDIRTFYIRFMSDLDKRVTKLCGQQFNITGHGFPATKLFRELYREEGGMLRSVKHF